MQPLPKEVTDSELVNFSNKISRLRQRNQEYASNDAVAIRLDPLCVIGRTLQGLGRYTAAQYLLRDEKRDIIGSITVLQASSDILSAANGPNDIFAEMSVQDIGLQRNAVTCNGCEYPPRSCLVSIY
jgi:hypothetical protein